MRRGIKFKELLLSEIDGGMTDIFGKETAKAVYYHLDKNYSLKLEDIPRKPKIFSKALESIFGKLGAEVIEMSLIKNLSSKFKLKHQKKEELKFSDYMNELMHKHFLKSKKHFNAHY